MNLTGIWLGQTIGDLNSAIHVWIIVDTGNYLSIHTHWLGFDMPQGFYRAKFQTKGMSDAIILDSGRHITIYNPNTFVVSNWVLKESNNEDDIEAKFYDVAFQRRDHGWIGWIVYFYIQLFQNSPKMLRQLNR
ncbi:MAG: hypothetical protein AAF846_11295 [Chloroflexota bacterium]